MKTVAAIEDIRAEMQRRINVSTWGRGYCAECAAPPPYRIPHDGVANWTANVAATTKRGCEGFLLEIIASMRHDYDLPPQMLRDVISHLIGGSKSLP